MLKRTGAALWLHKFQHMRGYTFRNQMKRGEQERILDMADPTFAKIHVAGYYGHEDKPWTRVLQHVYLHGGHYAFWCVVLTVNAVLLLLCFKLTRQDVAHVMPPILGGGGHLLGSSGGSHNWDDFNHNDNFGGDAAPTYGCTYHSAQRTRLRYDRFLHTRALRDQELANCAREVQEIRLNVA